MKKMTECFTLAEVLITLAIIGVVASLTIPALIQNTQNQETVAKVKKAYSTISAAYERAVVDNGSPDGWGWDAQGSGTGANNVLTILAPYLKITKNCGTSTGCFPDVTYKWLNGTDNNSNSNNTYIAKAQLADGTLMRTYSYSSNCSDGTSNNGSTPALSNVCGSVTFDVNGFNGPNQYGKDMFVFYITKYGVIPIGTSEDITAPPSSCDKTKDGAACTAWIIQKGNMDYLK